MAVLSNPKSSRFTLVQQVGSTMDGKPILKSKSYSNVKWDAIDQDVYDVGQALAALSLHPTLEIGRYDNEVLTNV